jgi:hypothetical protein
MDNNQNIKKPNPLSAYFRQPKIYMKLPSKGEYYVEGTLDKSTTNDYPVYAMTAKDELMLKTPDALLNGQSTVEVIKSCIPSIQDPWKMPSIDVDASLIAIRIATYGETMEVSTNCPHCEEENTYGINLVAWLDSLTAFQYDPTVQLDPLTVYIRPYTYREMTDTSLKTIEHQKIFQVINDSNLSDTEKLKQFGESFAKLTDLTVDVVARCIAKIETPDGSTDNTEQIREFLHNAPKEIFEKISGHIQDLKSKIDIPAQNVKCTSCEKDFVMPVSMDQSNFFAVRS